MPDALEVLLVVVAVAGGVTDQAGCEVAVLGKSGAEIDVLLTAVPGVPVEFGDGKPKSGVPLQWAAQLLGGCFDVGVSVTDVEYEGLDVAVEPDPAVDLSFDVVVQLVLLIGEGQVDEGHPAGDREGGGFQMAVRVAERRPCQGCRGQLQVG